MLSELNPYTPGSGVTPPELVGRQAEIDAFGLTVARSRAGVPSRGMVLHGLRGVGKTVLLGRFQGQAEQAEWFTVEIEGRPSDSGKEAVRQRLSRSLLVAARRFQRGKRVTPAVKAALSTVRSFSIAFGGASLELGIEPAQGRSDSGQIEVDFEELVEDLAPALQAASSAFALFIDEMQDLDAELLSALLSAQHRAGQKGWPFYIFGAGLPALPGVLAAACSYAERLFVYRAIDPLPADAAAEAFQANI
jgi:hypothetical protein